MNWIKKLIGASVLTSLFFIAPEKAQAESCGSCGLYNTGGYNLYVLGQNLNSVASCATPSTYTSPMVVPVYLSNPSAYLSSFMPATSGCGTFTQSCGSCYDTLGFGGYGTQPLTPSADSQLLQLISYQNLLLNQMSNPYLGSYPQTSYFPNYPYNNYTPPYVAPYYPPTNPVTPSVPVSPFDNSVPFPTTPSLTYGGCDNVTVMCPQPGVNTFENTFPGGSTGGSNGAVPLVSTYEPSIGNGSVPPSVYQIPRGLKTHR